MAERRGASFRSPTLEQATARADGATNTWGASVEGAGRSGRAGSLVNGAAEHWVGTLAAVVAAGWGVTVSGTRDGGAVCICLLVDGQPTKKYAGTPEDLETLLGELHDYAVSAAGA